jgi:uncharacterized protein (DUF983 family)
MPILFTCPHCGTKTQVADQYAGQTGPCSACGNVVTIPRPGGAGGAATGAAVGVSAVVIVVVLLMGLCIVVPVLLALLLPAVQAAREAARRMSCGNNLKQIGLALQNYHDLHNCYPPAYFADKDGQPMHSWRVIILRELGEPALYDQYKFDEPWDSPNNRRVAEQMPKVYQCPSDADRSNTDYMVIVGQETPFDGAKSTNMNDMTDGTSNTILVIEVKNSSTRWTEPKDLDFKRISFALNGPAPGDPGSRHPGGCQVLLADLTVKFVSKSIDPQVLRALATNAGGEMNSDF